MLVAYLWLNAALYLVFAIWCTFGWKQTSAAMGYVQLDGSGRSEFLTVYGGLQLGLAGVFAWCASSGDTRAGLVLALGVYLAIVSFRVASMLRNRPVSRVTRAVAGLEGALLAMALALWFGVVG